MLQPDIKVVRQAEETVYDQDLSRTSFVRVEFFVGKHGPFVERFPREGFTAAMRDLKLMEFAQQVRTEP